MARSEVGFVGLGLMGSSMAGRLLDRGHSLVLYNRTPEKASPLAARGASVAGSPAELAQRCASICLMVTDGPAVRAVLEDESGLASRLGSGHTVVNFSTIGIQAARDTDRAVRATGAAYLDAPVLEASDPPPPVSFWSLPAGRARCWIRSALCWTRSPAGSSTLDRSGAGARSS